MRTWKLQDMKKGFFIGDFIPACYKTKQFEVGYKLHHEGENWPKHYQKEATEINLVTRGVLKIGGKVFEKGDIFLISPMESLKPEFLTDCEVVCIKIPSLPKDKVIDT